MKNHNYSMNYLEPENVEPKQAEYGDNVESEVSIQVVGELSRVEDFEKEAAKLLEDLAKEHGLDVERVYVG